MCSTVGAMDASLLEYSYSWLRKHKIDTNVNNRIFVVLGCRAQYTSALWVL